jgi:hypothetical protein
MTILSLSLITKIIFILLIGMMISTPSHISLTHTIYAQKNQSANINVNNFGGAGDANNNIANESIAAINNKVVILTFLFSKYDVTFRKKGGRQKEKQKTGEQLLLRWNNLPYTEVFDRYIICVVPSKRGRWSSPSYDLIWFSSTFACTTSPSA